MRSLVFGLLWLLLLQAAGAAPLDELNQRYSSLCDATNIRYVDGMLAYRSPSFVVFGPDGKRVDLKRERFFTEQLMRDSLQVRRTWRIQSLWRVDGQRVRCLVHDVIRLQHLHPSSRKKVQSELHTISEDTWARDPRGAWSLESCRIRSQDLKNLVDSEAKTPN